MVYMLNTHAMIYVVYHIGFRCPYTRYLRGVTPFPACCHPERSEGSLAGPRADPSLRSG